MFPPHHGWKLACDRADWIAIGLDINRRKGNTCVWTRYQEWDGGNLTKVESTVPPLPAHSQRSTVRPRIPMTEKADENCESHTLTARDGNGTYCMRQRRRVFKLCRQDTRWT